MRKAISWPYNVEALTIYGKLVLFFAKVIYLTLRILLRIVLGKKRRDRWQYKKKGINFEILSFNFVCFLDLGNSSKLLKFKSPKYDYQFYCRRNIADFKTMTNHEEYIIDHFTPK